MIQEMSFAAYDKFQRKSFSDQLTKAIQLFPQHTKEAYVLALNATFGSGKTTFLKMWKHELDNDPQKKFKTILINAWETDFDDEPLIPIISSLLTNIDDKEEILKKTLTAVLAVTTSVANSLFEKVSGLDVKKISDEIKEDLIRDDLQKSGQEIYKKFNYKNKAYSELKDTLTWYIKTQELVIMVDELDRCRPDYCVKFLEAIKHIFPVKGLVFILAVDKTQLQESVKQLYGNIDFKNYFLRFITREVDLPEVGVNIEFNLFIKHLSEEYFLKGMHYPFQEEYKAQIIKHISDVCEAFKLTPRQSEYLFRIFSQFMLVDKVEKKAVVTWIHATIILIAIYIIEKELYQLIGTGKDDPIELNKWIDQLYFDGEDAQKTKNTFKWVIMSFTLNADPDKQKKIEEVVKDRNIKDLAKGADTFGNIHVKSAFQDIYSKFEEWGAFIE